MCGRYSLAAPPEELVEAFDVPDLTFDYRPRYNVAPGQDCPVVAEDRKGRRMGLMRWGLEPAWMDRTGSGFVNARAETVATKPSFRDSFERRRCLVPADGFYEWAKDGRTKTPHWFHPPGGGLVSFAGIWDGRTFAILTTDANGDVRDVHDRMPVVVAPEARAAWLDRASGPGSLARLLRPPPDGAFDHHPVSPRVNRTENEGPELVEPA